MKGQKCFDLYMSGKTYQQIADTLNKNNPLKNITRNDIARLIYNFRKENKIPPDYGNRAKEKGDQDYKEPKSRGSTRKNHLSQSEKLASQKREAALKLCPKNSKGVTLCPPAMRDDILFATAPDAVLFMWAVWPKLPFALQLMEHWGFKYKTGGAWHKKTKHGKDAFGTGYILRSSCEPFIIGTYGNAEILNRSTRNIIEDENLIVDTLREHSRKPDSVYGYIEHLLPGAYLELFARQSKPGWDSWGNETDKFEAAA